MALSKPQIKHLRQLAHHAKVIISIGQHGISENVLSELESALEFHELVKIKITGEDREARQAIIEQLCADSGAEKIQAIGKTLTLFRRNSRKPKIEF